MKRYISILLLSLTTLTALAGEKGAFLGVTVHPLNEELKAKLGYDGKGVVIQHIVDSSNAEKFGLRVHDVLISFNGQDVSDPKTLVELIREKAPEDQVTLKLFSEGSLTTVEVALGERELHIKTNRFVQVDHVERPWIGIQMQDLNPQLAEFFMVEGGILVTRVEPESPAQRAGLTAGDILLNWQGTPLEGSGALHELLSQAKENDEIQFTVQRHEEQMEIPVVLGKRESGEWFDRDGQHFRFSHGEFLKSLEGLHQSEELLKHPREGAKVFEFRSHSDDKALMEEIHRLKGEMESLREQLHEKQSEKEKDR